MSKQRECTDPGCPVHPGQSACAAVGTEYLRRIDMDDRTGVRFCEECRVDAWESGLFEVQP